MRYHRVPLRVEATILSAPWVWSTLNGDVLLAHAGDFRVTDPDSGRQWSITADALRSGYSKVGHGLYESRGEVVAFRVSDQQGEIAIQSLEGPENARPGDWIITDDNNNHWVVDNEWFHERYRPCSGP